MRMNFGLCQNDTNKSFSNKSGRIAREAADRRANNRVGPVLDNYGNPILTSVWCPTMEQLVEIRTHPFHGSVKFTGRTFPFVIRNLVQLYSREGDLVYDPMFGSGTSIYEAYQLKRRVMGSDLNANNVESFKRRWKQHCGGSMPEVRQCSARELVHVESESVSLVIMSFPWFTGWKFNEDNESMEHAESLDEFAQRGVLIYKEMRRILKVGGFVANIMGNTFHQGVYYPATSYLPEMIRQSGMVFHYQFWSLRVVSESLREPWNRSGLDTKIGKAAAGVGWDVHEDIVIARK